MTVAEYNKSVDLFADNLYRFVLKNIRDESRAKDIVQDVFAKVWQKIDSISYSKIKSYLFTTAYNRIVDVVRKEKRIVELGEDVDVGSDSNHTHLGLKEVLEIALNRLPTIQKTVILLRDYEGYSYKEIGEITALTEQQVKVYIYRARKTLQQYLVSIETHI